MGRKVNDLTGLKFGRLLVISFNEVRNKNAYWNCLCDCGKQTITQGACLKNGSIVSCGCYFLQRITEVNTRIYPNQKYGKLTVLRRCYEIQSKNPKYECLCECGNIIVTRGDCLRNGGTKSCGCDRIESIKRVNTRHGLSRDKSYRSFLSRKRRDNSEWTYAMEIALKKLQRECVLCGNKYALSIDHVRPFSLGYKLEPGNVVILCRSCNSKKKDIDLNLLPQEIQWKIIQAADKFRLYWQENSHNYELEPF